jgi:hypothetical protein
MSGHWTDEFSFTGGAVRDKVTGYFSLVGDEGAENKVPHVVFTAWRSGSWYDAGKKRWNIAGVAVSHEPIAQMVAVSQWGDVLCTGSGDTHDEHVATGAAKPVNDRGPLTGVRRIGKAIYVVGMDRQVYRRTGVNAWSEISPKPKRKEKKDDPKGFQAIHGFSEKDIYAVGWDGEIWHYDGASWKELPSITNQVLVDVCCAGDGIVYACGREGLLIKGRADKWEIVDTDDLEEDFWSLAWFEDQLFIASLYNLYTLGKKGLAEVSMGKDTPGTCNRLAADEGVLWSIGAKDVMAFDGKKWTRID